MKPVLFFAVFISLLPAALRAQQWQSDYLPAQRAGDLSVCTAGVDYQNAWFTIRLYDERIDFLLYRNDFTLPYESELGALLFEVDGNPFRLVARTFPRRPDDAINTAQLMQILPNNDDVVDLLRLLQAGTSFQIIFPNGDYYNTSLRGSRAAIDAALICWERNHTGPLDNNPFSPEEMPSEEAQGNNPFET